MDSRGQNGKEQQYFEKRKPLNDTMCVLTLHHVRVLNGVINIAGYSSYSSNQQKYYHSFAKN